MSNKTELVRQIECDCGEWEEFPADMKRTKSQSFEHINDLAENEARYLCDCGNIINSQCVEVEREE